MEVKSFIIIFFRDSEITKTLIIIREITHSVLFLQNVSIVPMKDILKRHVFEKRDGDWIDILPTITKQNNNRLDSSTKLTPIQASLKKNEGYVYRNHIRQTKESKTKVSENQSCQNSRFKENILKIGFD